MELDGAFLLGLLMGWKQVVKLVYIDSFVF